MSEQDLPESVQTVSVERVGGGGYTWESGVYDTMATMVYLDQAKSEAVSFNIILKNNDGKELKESFWIKSGKAKGNKTFYTKDGKDFPLPGYSTANSMCVAITGNSLSKCMESAEKKQVNIYNPEEKKELPTERPVLMSLVNKPVRVAVHQITEDKRKKNDATGQYEATGETRSTNECKFFGDVASGKTAEETLAGSEAGMFAKWAEKNTGQVIDKTTKTDGVASAAEIIGGGTAKATGAMFK